MKKLEIYKCSECGLVVEVIKGCDCVPACCGKSMQLMPSHTAEFKFEKHVPYPESIEGGTRSPFFFEGLLASLDSLSCVVPEHATVSRFIR